MCCLGLLYIYMQHMYMYLCLLKFVALKHSNFPSLLFVLLPDSLSRVFTVEGMRNGVCSLYTTKCKWDDVIMPNVRHIMRGILRGTAYLHDMSIQHVDLKGM